MIQPAVSRLTISQPTRLRAARSQTRATDRELGHFIVSIVAAVATEVKRPRSQTPEEALGIVEESPCDAHVLDVSMGHGRDRAVVEEQDLGLGQRHEDRRVRGDDELAILGHPVLKDGQEREHARPRERSLGLVGT